MTPIPCLNSLASLLSLLGQPVLLGKRHGTAWAKRRGNQESLGYAEKKRESLDYTDGDMGQSCIYTHVCVYTSHIRKPCVGCWVSKMCGWPFPAIETLLLFTEALKSHEVPCINCCRWILGHMGSVEGNRLSCQCPRECSCFLFRHIPWIWIYIEGHMIPLDLNSG